MKKTLVFLGVVALVACNQPSAVGPTEVEPPPLPDLATVSEKVKPPVSPTDTSDETRGFEITDDGKMAYSTVTNELSKASGFALACYKGNMGNLEEQELVGNPSVVRLRVGEKHDFSALLACGVLNQCDNLFNIRNVPDKPPHSSKTLNSKIIKGDDCPLPPCRPPAKPPRCEYGPARYDPKNCTYACPPCVMPPTPKCPFGPAIAEGCGWTCPPCMKQCPEGTHLHPETCDCWCNPVGKPECAEQTWNENTCSWEGDCPCEYSLSHPKVGQVFCHNLVIQKLECSHFAPGTTQVGYDGGSTPNASMSADVVIVKAGGGKVCGKKKRYIVYQDVTVGDPLKSGWSHTTYCNCSQPE